MNKILSFITTEPGFMFSVIAFSLSATIGGLLIQDYIHYKNFQTSLKEVMECRKAVTQSTITQVGRICGDIPTWDQFKK